jgi:1-deoxy-D-xylulose-5-phosphate synthase
VDPVSLLPSIETPADLRALTYEQLDQLAGEIRTFIVETVTTTGGHLGSNLGAVELTLALHRVFESPRDAILWDTGHQAYVHKLLTGRRYGFRDLRQAGGLSGYPNRHESEHDWIENSHASTALSYAHGLASAFELRGEAIGRGGDRRVVAVVGDGALTGGMAYEALNNLGHSGRRVVIVLNDNGRSYAPTVSHLSQSLTSLRLNPTYVSARERLRSRIRDLPGVGELAYSGVHGLTSALRELVAPHTFFEALGVRYAGPIDGHDIDVMEQAFAHAAEWEGPIVVHVLTQKGRGYAPAEEDEIQRLHDVKALRPAAPENVVGTTVGASVGGSEGGDTRTESQNPPAAPGPDIRPTTYTDAFTRALLREAERRPEVVALTAAMPGPTGLLPFEARFPERFFDVGIAEQHEMTAAAGMAMGGLRPVVAVYSTFFSRAFDQANLDVGLHGLPVLIVLDRAGITGDDGPSHHGLLDLALALAIPGMTVFAPSSAEDLDAMVTTALELDGPATIRFPKTPARHVPADEVGQGLDARLVRQGDGSVCLLGVGKLLAACEEAAGALALDGVEATVWDVRVVSPPDPRLLADAAAHGVVVTAEDGVATGGAGTFLAGALAQLTEADGQPTPAVHPLGVPRAYVAQGRADHILAGLGLDGPGIARSVRRILAHDRHAAERGALDRTVGAGVGDGTPAPAAAADEPRTPDDGPGPG